MSKKTNTKNIHLKRARKNAVFAESHEELKKLGDYHTTTLYRVVYTGKLSTVCVFLLLLSFIFQGAQISFAAEVESESNNTEKVDIDSSTAETKSENTTSFEKDALNAEEQIDHNLDQETEEDNVTTDSEIDFEIADDDVDAEDNNASDEEMVNEPATETGVIDEAETSSESDGEVDDSSNPSVDLETATSSVEFDDEVNETENDDLLTSDLIEEEIMESQETTEVVSVTNSAAVFSFNQNQCTELATGSFYCHKENKDILKDALFAAPDEDGDMEIYMVKNGEQAQITNNKFDDLAPYFDKNSNTIVWHRLINDRYQIISYEVDSQLEIQLTRTNENNMEPTRQGKYTVWQRWIDGGWNIVLHDGEAETQLTKTTDPDIAPYVHGSLVVWNRHALDGERTIEMYDIVSQTFVSINDPDGLSVSNPRMVFVYDSLHPNGDVVTKGYDVLTQEFIDLDTLPRNLPDELPDNDSTGETRALIQNKPSLKSEVEESLEEANPPLPPPEQPVTNSTSTAVTEVLPELTLDLSTSTIEVDSAATTTEIALPEPPELIEYDLVIEPFTATTSEEGV